MEPSEEIRRIIERFTRAIAEGDDESALERLSEHEGTLIVGTDPAEWWRGREARAVWGRQIKELLGAFSVRADEIEAWEEGNVGWAGVKETVSVGGRTLEARATYVLHLERGEWKVVQVHWSFPQANVETLGRSVTVTIDELEKIVQREQPDLLQTADSDGTVTIAFTDIAESTVLLRRLGDRAWVDVLRRHNAVIEEATSARGGTVVVIQGDGSMLAFPSARGAVAVRRRFSATSLAHSRMAHRRSASGSAFTPVTRSTPASISTAPRSTMRLAWRARPSAARCSCRAWCATSSPAPASTSARVVRWELKGLDGLHRLFAVDLAHTGQGPH